MARSQRGKNGFDGPGASRAKPETSLILACIPGPAAGGEAGLWDGLLSSFLVIFCVSLTIWGDFAARCQRGKNRFNGPGASHAKPESSLVLACIPGLAAGGEVGPWDVYFHVF